MPIPRPGDTPWLGQPPKPPIKTAATLVVTAALLLPGAALGAHRDPAGMRGKIAPAGMRGKLDPAGMRGKAPVGMRHRVDIKLAQHRR